MINLFANLDSYKDNKGFIVLSELPSFKKIWDKLDSLPNYVPLTKSAPNYPWQKKDATGTPYYESFVSVYFYKLTKSSFGNWVQISLKKDTYNYKSEDTNSYSDRRECYLIFVLKTELINSHNNGRTISIAYLDINGNIKYLDIPLYDACNIAIRFLPKKQIEYINDLMSTLSPEPYIEKFLIKPEYKEDYNLYVSDAKKYGYDKNIWAKELIDSAPTDTQIDKDGYVYGGRSVDVRYVNK